MSECFSIIRVDSTEGLKKLLPSFTAVYDSPHDFKELYLFAFSFAKEEDQKSLSLDVCTCAVFFSCC